MINIIFDFFLLKVGLPFLIQSTILHYTKHLHIQLQIHFFL